MPATPDGFTRIRLLRGGICNTDLELQRGYYGFKGTPGHEFVAEVVNADDADWIGKRVVGEINLACGKCDWCARNLGRHCPNRTVLGIVKRCRLRLVDCRLGCLVGCGDENVAGCGDVKRG